MSSVGRDHPVGLPWYAAGQLHAADAAAIDRHVRSCEECKAEVEALRTVYAHLRESGAGHPTVERLVAYHDGALALQDERHAIEAHLPACQDCEADLAALARADAPRRHSWKRPIAAAASFLVVAVLGWWVAAPPPRVVFAPAQRGIDSGPSLSGDGPWTFEVWPPLHATQEPYLARIQRGDASSATVFDAVVAPSAPDGKLVFRVPGPLLAGHYRLLLIPQGGDGTPADVRGFDVGRAR